MIGLSHRTRVLVFSEPTDMRKGHNGLFGAVMAANEDPYSGTLFVFISRTRNRAKVLVFERGGFVLWYKRLEKGRFRHPRSDDTYVEVDATALAMLLDGINVADVERPALWQPKGIDNHTQM